MEPSNELRFELGAPGPLRDRLVAAVLAGDKVATSSLLVQYDDESEPRPAPGERRIMVDSSGAPAGVVELLDVRVIRLGDADLQLAVDEAEGFGSVAEWREAHEVFWNEQILPSLRMPDGWSLDDDTEVLVERFRLVGGAPRR